MNKQEMNNKMIELCTSLMDDVIAVKNGSLDYTLAMHVNRLSCSAIRTLATVVVANNHQVIQERKLEMRKQELGYKNR